MATEPRCADATLRDTITIRAEADRLEFRGTDPLHIAEETRPMTDAELWVLARTAAAAIARRFGEEIDEVSNVCFLELRRLDPLWHTGRRTPRWRWLLWRINRAAGRLVLREIRGMHRRGDGTWRGVGLIGAAEPAEMTR